MAKRIPNSCDNSILMDKMKFRIDETTGEVSISVTDTDANTLLAQILAALGGSSDTVSSVSNITILNAGVEQEIPLPADTKKFILRSRNKGILKLSYASGGTSTDYATLLQGTVYEDGNFYQSQSIFIQSSKPGDVIELITHV